MCARLASLDFEAQTAHRAFSLKYPHQVPKSQRGSITCHGAHQVGGEPRPQRIYPDINSRKNRKNARGGRDFVYASWLSCDILPANDHSTSLESRVSGRQRLAHIAKIPGRTFRPRKHKLVATTIPTDGAKGFDMTFEEFISTTVSRPRPGSKQCHSAQAIAYPEARLPRSTDGEA